MMNAEKLRAAKRFLAALDEAAEMSNPNGVDLDGPWDSLVMSCDGFQREAEKEASLVIDIVTNYRKVRGAA